MAAARSAAALAAIALCAAEPAARQSTGPLPDRATFLREVRENLARAQELSHQFAYKERRTDMHMNPFGRMGTGEMRVSEVYPASIPQLTFRRVVQRNGLPVSAADLAEQEQEYREKVAGVRRRLAREDEDDREERERDELLARRRALRMIDDVVAALDFDVARRETRDGVRTIVIAFTGRPAATPHTREGRVAKVFKGHAWVDEAAREVVHVEAVATDDVSFGGFIAKLYEGTHASLERDEIAPGVWLPTRVKLEGEARALFRKMKIDYLIEWFDYRRLPATFTER
jgi:hypothetical protein